MCKKMVRSALALAFSVGVALGAVSTLDLHWGSSATGVQAIAPPDLHWGGAPVIDSESKTDVAA
ncbi:hypothetical protein V2W30_21040 [Streptomyces sp. Q6]|uniref:Uncharacterized protein n=1 Tax=Streptomyces citrinus TaxID=3118173 RepID=A0ACD5AEG3_9ACTN